MNQEAITRKANSIKILKQQNVPYIEHLPYIEGKENVRIRTKEEIAKRAIACLIIIQLACDINQSNDAETVAESKAFVTDLLQKYEVSDLLTQNEKHLLDGIDITPQEVINMIWKYEAYWVLLWSLGLVPELEFPSETCDCDFAIHIVADCEDFEEFLELTTLRSIDEILDQVDLIFRYDWACVDARIKEKEAPADLNSSVVLERHRGLNWLIDIDQENDWDHVSTNT